MSASSPASESVSIGSPFLGDSLRHEMRRGCLPTLHRRGTPLELQQTVRTQIFVSGRPAPITEPVSVVRFCFSSAYI